MWLERAGNVCGREVYSRPDAETYSTVRLLHTHASCTHTHTHTHTLTATHKPERGHAWAEMEQKPEGIRCRARGSRAAANIPDGKLSEQKQVFKFTEAILLLRESGEQLELLRPRHTHTYTHARAQTSTDTTSRQAWDGAWQRDNGNIQQQYTSKSDKTNIFFLMGFSRYKLTFEISLRFFCRNVYWHPRATNKRFQNFFYSIKRKYESEHTVPQELISFYMWPKTKTCNYFPALHCRWLLKCTIMESISCTRQSLKMIN